VLSLPDSARISCWLNAWLTDRESTDEVITGLNGDRRLAEFVGPQELERLSPALFLRELRRHGVRRVSAALPIPGDPLGLGGPTSFNADALDAGEALIMHGPDLGLVPSPAGEVTRWQVSTAQPPAYLASVSEADHALKQATAKAADRLAELDVASWSPDVVDILLNLRQSPPLNQPASFANPAAARLMHDALRAARIVALAGRDDGGAVSVSEVSRRAAALQPLERASRVAVVAAASTLAGR
jgi:hypothetical protein